MTSTALLGPDAGTVEMIVSDIFLGMLAVEDAPYPYPHGGAPLPVTAAVSVTGEWSGHVVISCSDAVARHIASTLLLTDEVSPEDLSDAVGEFANVLGGNVKAVMPGPSVLSLPRVVFGPVTERLPSSVEVLRLALSWRGEPLVITIWAAAARSPEE